MDDETRLAIASKPVDSSSGRLTEWNENMEMFRRARERKDRIAREQKALQPHGFDTTYYDSYYHRTEKVRHVPMPGKQWIDVVIRDTIIGMPGWAVLNGRSEKESRGEICLKVGEICKIEKYQAIELLMTSVAPPFDIWHKGRHGRMQAWPLPRGKMFAAIGRLAR